MAFWEVSATCIIWDGQKRKKDVYSAHTRTFLLPRGISLAETMSRPKKLFSPDSLLTPKNLERMFKRELSLLIRSVERWNRETKTSLESLI